MQVLDSEEVDFSYIIMWEDFCSIIHYQIILLENSSLMFYQQANRKDFKK